MAGRRATTEAASFVYGSPETAEDLEFWLTCEPKTKETELTVYVDITGTKVGQAMPIEISRRLGQDHGQRQDRDPTK